MDTLSLISWAKNKTYKKINIKKLEYNCIRCGQCCKGSICQIAEALEIKETLPCSVLEYDNDKNIYSCGIITNPQKHIVDSVLEGEKKLWMSQYLKRLLFIGKCSNAYRLERIKGRTP